MEDIYGRRRTWTTKAYANGKHRHVKEKEAGGERSRTSRRLDVSSWRSIRGGLHELAAAAATTRRHQPKLVSVGQLSVFTSTMSCGFKQEDWRRHNRLAKKKEHTQLAAGGGGGPGGGARERRTRTDTEGGLDEISNHQRKIQSRNMCGSTNLKSSIKLSHEGCRRRSRDRCWGRRLWPSETRRHRGSSVRPHGGGRGLQPPILPPTWWSSHRWETPRVLWGIRGRRARSPPAGRRLRGPPWRTSRSRPRAARARRPRGPHAEGARLRRPPQRCSWGCGSPWRAAELVLHQSAPVDHVPVGVVY